MSDQGPLLESLTRRLAECPREYLMEPAKGQGGNGAISPDAVVADMIYELSPGPALEFARYRALNRAPMPRLVLLAARVLSDPWFRGRAPLAERAAELATGPTLAALASIVGLENFVQDPDRREELVRICLKALHLTPAGESDAQADDRLKTLDSCERQRVIKETKAAKERAEALRKAMAKKAAEEAAASYGRE